jgi:hypothetical protein
MVDAWLQLHNYRGSEEMPPGNATLRWVLLSVGMKIFVPGSPERIQLKQLSLCRKYTAIVFQSTEIIYGNAKVVWILPLNLGRLMSLVKAMIIRMTLMC